MFYLVSIRNHNPARNEYGSDTPSSTLTSIYFATVNLAPNNNCNKKMINFRNFEAGNWNKG